jgi:hypothetical protein
MQVLPHARRSLVALFVVALTVVTGAHVASATTTTPAPVTGYHGVFQFTDYPQVNNRSVVGGVLLFSWADLEPTHGSFRWDLIDAKALPWVSHGKKIAIRIQTAGPDSKGVTSTPSWLFNLGVPSVSTGATRVPVYWNPLFLGNLQTFATAFSTRYEGKPYLAWVQGGIGISGETKIDNSAGRTSGLPAWRAAGYTDALWFATIKQIVGAFHGGLHSTPLVVSVANTFPGGTPGYADSLVIDWLAASAVWPQNDSLRQNTVLTNPTWHTSPSTQEQYKSTSNTGDTLRGDLSRAISLGATYAIIYGSDIKNPANQSALDWAAAQVAA